MTEPATTSRPDPAAPAGRSATGMEIAALICAFLIAPVGLILGLVARSTAKKEGTKPHVLATLSIVLGSVFTAVGIVSIVVSAILLGTIASGANKAAQCAQLGSDVSVLESFARMKGTYDQSATEAVKAIAERILANPPSTQLKVVADGLDHGANGLLSSEGQGVLMDDTTWDSAHALATTIQEFCAAG